MRKTLLRVVLCLIVLFVSACNKQNGNLANENVVIPEEEAVNNGTYDSVTLMGESRGINYYFATTTDVSLAPLFGDGQYWFDEFENEQQLMESDCKKVKDMMKFYNYESIDNLLNAFVEI